MYRIPENTDDLELTPYTLEDAIILLDNQESTDDYVIATVERGLNSFSEN